MPSFKSLTTSMPNGVTNAAPWQTFGAAGMPDPGWAHVYHNDFNTYTAGDWTVSKVGTGTQAVTDFNGGAILLSNTSGATDATYMQLASAGFQFSAGDVTCFRFIGQLSDLLNTGYWGLVQKGATTTASITDGIFLTKGTSASGALTLNIRVGGAAQTVALPTLCALTAATTFELGIVVDSGGNVGAYFNPTTGIGAINAAASPTNFRGPVAVLTAPTLPTALLTPAFGFLNTSALARTMTVDCLTVYNER